jgi:hypothetical protein
MKISEIDHIVFGPSSSRFWLFRKHTNQIDLLKFSAEPPVEFYAW